MLKAGTAALSGTSWKMVANQYQHRSALRQRLIDIITQQIAQIRPAKVKNATQIAVGLNNPQRRLGSMRQMDPAIHAF